MGQTLAKQQKEKFRKDNKIIGFLGDEYPIESYFTKLSIITAQGKWKPAEAEESVSLMNTQTTATPELPGDDKANHDHNVHPTAVYSLKAEKEITTSVLEEIENICNNNTTPGNTNKILLIGEPGIGKSCLVRYICYQWSIDQLWNQKFNHIWFIELKELIGWLMDSSMDGYLMEKNNKLVIRAFTSKAEKYSNFLYYLEKKKCPDMLPTIKKHDIAKSIMKPKELFLFDGYDEIALNLFQFQEAKGGLPAIDPWKEAKELIDTFSNYIVTSRPNAIYEQKIQEKIHFDKTLINLGFTQDGRLAYVKRYYSTKKDITLELKEELINTITKYIEESQVIKDICRIPLNVEILCYLWCEDYYRDKLNYEEFNLTILYSLIEMKLAEWFSYKNEGKKTVTVELRQFLQRLSFLSLFKNQVRGVNQATIGELLTVRFPNGNKTLKEEFMKDVGNLGFVHPVYPSWPTRMQDHYYNHKTFQEYFAAQFITEMIDSPITDISETLQQFNLKKFLMENCWNPYYLQMYKFVCGLLSLHQEVRLKEEENKKKMEAFLTIILEATTTSTDADGNGRKQYALIMHLFSQIPFPFVKNINESLSILQLCMNHLTKYLISNPVELSSVIIETGYNLSLVINMILTMLSNPTTEDRDKISILRLMRNVNRGYPQYPQVVESIMNFLSLHEEDAVKQLLTNPEILDEALCTLAIISYKDQNVVQRVTAFIGFTGYQNVISGLSFLSGVLPTNELLHCINCIQSFSPLILSFCLTSLDSLPAREVYEMLGKVDSDFVDNQLRELINLFVSKPGSFRKFFIPEIIRALVKAPPEEAVKHATICSLINLTSEEAAAICNILLNYQLKLKSSVRCLGMIGNSAAVIDGLLHVAETDGIAGREIVINICKIILKNPSLCSTNLLRNILRKEAACSGHLFRFIFNAAPNLTNLAVELIIQRIMNDFSEFEYWESYLLNIYDDERESERLETVLSLIQNFYSQLLIELMKNGILQDIYITSESFFNFLQIKSLDFQEQNLGIIREVINTAIVSHKSKVKFQTSSPPVKSLNISYKLDDSQKDQHSRLVLTELRLRDFQKNDCRIDLVQLLQTWPIIFDAIELLMDGPHQKIGCKTHDSYSTSCFTESFSLRTGSAVELNVIIPVELIMQYTNSAEDYLILLVEFLDLLSRQDVKSLEVLWKVYTDILEKKELSVDIVSSLFVEVSPAPVALLASLFIKFEKLFDLSLTNKLRGLLKDSAEPLDHLLIKALALSLYRFPAQISDDEVNVFLQVLGLDYDKYLSTREFTYFVLLHKPPPLLPFSESIINDPSFNRDLMHTVCRLLESCHQAILFKAFFRFIYLLIFVIILDSQDFRENITHLQYYVILIDIIRYETEVETYENHDVRQAIVFCVSQIFNYPCKHLDIVEPKRRSEMEQLFLDDTKTLINGSSADVPSSKLQKQHEKEHPDSQQQLSGEVKISARIRLLLAALVNPDKFTMEIIKDLANIKDPERILFLLYITNKSLRDYDDQNQFQFLKIVMKKLGLFFLHPAIQEASTERLIAIMFALEIVHNDSLKFLIKMKDLCPIEFQKFSTENFYMLSRSCLFLIGIDHQLLFELFPFHAFAFFKKVCYDSSLSKKRKKEILSILSANISAKQDIITENKYFFLIDLFLKNLDELCFKLLVKLKDSLPIKKDHNTYAERIVDRHIFTTITGLLTGNRWRSKIQSLNRNRDYFESQYSFYRVFLTRYINKYRYSSMTENYRKELISFLFSLLSINDCFSVDPFRTLIEILSLPKPQRQIILDRENQPFIIPFELEMGLIEKILPQLINDLSSRFEVIQRRAIHLIYYPRYHEESLVTAINENQILTLERIHTIELLYPLMERLIHDHPQQERRRFNLIKDTLADKKRALLQEEMNFQIKVLLPPSHSYKSTLLFPPNPPPSTMTMIHNNTIPRYEYDIFLSHDWGVNNQNHHWVSKINDRLKEKGLKTWFDEEQIKGDIRAAMVYGIEHSKLMLVFITENYANKINRNDTRDNCRYEFKYGFEKIGPNKMIPIVMEANMRSTRNWPGELGAGVGTLLYQDLSELVASEEVDEGLWSQAIDQLYEKIKSLLN